VQIYHKFIQLLQRKGIHKKAHSCCEPGKRLIINYSLKRIARNIFRPAALIPLANVLYWVSKILSIPV